jgi:hypothetical protein
MTLPASVRGRSLIEPSSGVLRDEPVLGEMIDRLIDVLRWEQVRLARGPIRYVGVEVRSISTQSNTMLECPMNCRK